MVLLIWVRGLGVGLYRVSNVGAGVARVLEECARVDGVSCRGRMQRSVSALRHVVFCPRFVEEAWGEFEDFMV